MTNLKKLGAAVILTFALRLFAFADCPVPGIMQAPPCVAAAQTVPDDPAAPGIIGGPPAASASLDLVSIAELALTSLLLY